LPPSRDDDEQPQRQVAREELSQKSTPVKKRRKRSLRLARDPGHYYNFKSSFPVRSLQSA
jgi:hypothetical protein